jgi:methylated-DNA-[protein]-cysteine S-methyltransferase
MDADTKITTTRPAIVGHDTPIGRLTLVATADGLVNATFGALRPTAERLVGDLEGERWLDLARRELDEYFAGRLRAFTVPVDPRLSGAFDRRVLAGLATVGYGDTTTYGRLAGQLGLLRDYPPHQAAQRVGQALARNPVLVVVPCHRVVGADGGLVGYAAGLPAKRHLLDLEAARDMLELGI